MFFLLSFNLYDQIQSLKKVIHLFAFLTD